MTFKSPTTTPTTRTRHRNVFHLWRTSDADANVTLTREWRRRVFRYVTLEESGIKLTTNISCVCQKDPSIVEEKTAPHFAPNLGPRKK
jgi:hypothetical protein